MTASDRLFGTSISRWLAVFAAALLALTLLPATSAFGQEDVDDPEDACPEDPPPAPYTDRDEIPEVHVRNVDCVTHRNIALGFADGTYRPALPVPRDQMASFVARTLEEAGFTLPDGGPPPEFDDIAGNTHEDRINQLARAGIVEGGPEELPPTSYGPRRLVRRDQMASYLMRAAAWALEQDFGETDQRFPDVPPGNVHFENVNGAHERNIALGYADGTYGPRDSTRRDQMASFLSRLLNFLETFEPEPVPTPEPTPEPEFPDNQTFSVEPHDTQIVELDDNGDGAVQYVASGLEPGEDYELALFPCGNPGEDASVKRNNERYPDRDGGSQGSESGFFEFRDQDLDDEADNVGSTQNGQAEILTVGFTPINLPQTLVTAGADGTVSFRVGILGGDGDCAVPVIWLDDDGDSNLDLNEDSTDSWNEPSDDEPFGVGGTALFHSGEAPNGHDMENDVIFVNIAEMYWVDTDGFQFFWGRPGDSYFYDGSEVEAPMSQTLWELYLSIGDNTSDDQGTVYNRVGDVIFELEDDTPGTPLNVTLEVTDDDEITVTWDHPDPLEGNDDQGCVELLEADTFAFVASDCTDEVDTLSPRQSETELVFDGLADGDYVARVEIDSETDDDGDWSRLSNVATVGVEPEDALITDQRVTSDTPTVGLFDDGDEARIRFDHEMDPDTSNAVFFRWQDEDGSVYQVACADQATCTWQAVGVNANRQLTMVLTADPVHLSGPDNGLDITGEGALMIFVSAGVQTADGGGVDLANSPDRRLNIAPALP